jgi:ribosomal protein S18 acetylase RimI-like enzyme
MLVQHAENLMEGMDALCIELEVYGRVEEQQKFYDRIGYKETTRQKRSGEEIVLMRKIFNEEVEEEEPL